MQQLAKHRDKLVSLERIRPFKFAEWSDRRITKKRSWRGFVTFFTNWTITIWLTSWRLKDELFPPEKKSLAAAGKKTAPQTNLCHVAPCWWWSQCSEKSSQVLKSFHRSSIAASNHRFARGSRLWCCMPRKCVDTEREREREREKKRERKL